MAMKFGAIIQLSGYQPLPFKISPLLMPLEMPSYSKIDIRFLLLALYYYMRLLVLLNRSNIGFIIII